MELTLKRWLGVARQGAIVRVQSPIGTYPEVVIGNKDSAFVFDKDISYSIVRLKKPPRIRDYYSEVEWATPEEIALYSSLELSAQYGDMPITIYPLQDCHIMNLHPNTKLNNPNLHKIIKDKLMSSLSTEVLPSCFHNSLTSPSLAPFQSNNPYQTCGNSFLPERQSSLLAAIDPADHLMIRGLSTFLRSAMLCRHRHFLEEAIITLFVSLEATFRLVLRRLKDSGIPNPTSGDAANFVAKAFNQEPIEKYFSEYYDSRIMALHPESRFGTFPHAPLMADDFYDLHESLRAMYVFLITGEVEIWQ